MRRYTCNWKEASWRRRATRCEKECGAAKPWTMGRTLACHFPPLEHTACSMFRCLQHLDPPPETGHPACCGLSAPPQTSAFICQLSNLSFKTSSWRNGMTYWLPVKTKMAWALSILWDRTGKVTVMLQFFWIWMSQCVSAQASVQQMAKLAAFLK